MLPEAGGPTVKTKLQPMWLTDDEVHVLYQGCLATAVRLRVWRSAGNRSFVLAEPAGGEDIAPMACRIMTFVHHCVVKAQECVYIEHEGEAWQVVTFMWVRHAAAEPYRKAVNRKDLETCLGVDIGA